MDSPDLIPLEIPIWAAAAVSVTLLSILSFLFTVLKRAASPSVVPGPAEHEL